MKFYVYQHANPETGEILYIGKGSYERAWLCRGSNRSPEYSVYLKNLLENGYTMDDLVTILQKGLTNEAAEKFESKLILEIQPIFNKQQTKKWVSPKKFFGEVVDTIKSLKEMGYGSQTIAFLMGGDKVTNAMTMWRITND